MTVEKIMVWDEQKSAQVVYMGLLAMTAFASRSANIFETPTGSINQFQRTRPPVMAQDEALHREITGPDFEIVARH